MTPAEFWTSAGPFSVGELAAVARVSPSLVRKIVTAGSLRVCRAGRALRIPASEARRWALEVGAEPPEATHQAHDARDAHQTLAVK
jgi:excisionase family DNA binding protein